MRILLVAFSVLTACSSSETAPTTTTDTGSVAETGPAVECSAAKNGDACAVDGDKCDHPIDCGPTAGTFGTCVSGKWKIVTNPCTTGDSGPDTAHD